MKTILIQFPGHGGGRLFDPSARDAVTEPFIHLRARLAGEGYRLETADDRPVEGTAFVLFWDFHESSRASAPLRRAARALGRLLHGGTDSAAAAGDPPLGGPIAGAPRAGRSDRVLYEECARAGLLERTILVTGEPPVVLPANWDPRVHALFGTILTWNDRLVDGRRFQKFLWPIAAAAAPVEPVPFERKKLLVNISGNKVSSHPRELYSARRAAVRHFERHRPAEFDLFGFGWDRRGAAASGEPPYPSYRGTIRNKRDAYPGYRFGLCYENMRDEPGWITEKIFDCMRADCVPVYWGAPNVTDFVDAGTFVDRRRFRSDADLERHLSEITPEEYARYRAAIRAYLGGERFARFLSPAFAETILGVLRRLSRS
jgi:alpha(1,3/1,4) fucosyltransferase